MASYFNEKQTPCLFPDTVKAQAQFCPKKYIEVSTERLKKTCSSLCFVKSGLLYNDGEKVYLLRQNADLSVVPNAVARPYISESAITSLQTDANGFCCIGKDAFIYRFGKEMKCEAKCALPSAALELHRTVKQHVRLVQCNDKLFVYNVSLNEVVTSYDLLFAVPSCIAIPRIRESTILVGGKDGILRIIVSTTGQVLTQMEVTDSITCLSLSSTNKFVAVGGNDGTVTILRYEDLTPITFINAHTAPIFKLTISANEQYVTVVSPSGIPGRKGLLTICMVTTGQVIYSLEEDITAITWHVHLPVLAIATKEHIAFIGVPETHKKDKIKTKE